VKPVIEKVIEIVKENPNVEYGYIHAYLTRAFPGYGKPEKCFNCNRSMKITVYEADLLDALLILAMGREIRMSMAKGVPFTEANKVHLPTLEATNATLKRNTKCDYLGLVKQPENWRGTGYWLLTGWGWKALRGDSIPANVKYWEGHLIERSQETTTLTEMFGKHRTLIENAIQKQKEIKVDHRAKFDEYNPSEWSEFGGYINGQLL